MCARLCLCDFKMTIEGADRIHWDTRGHRHKERKCTFSISQGGGMRGWDSWRVRGCRWCWTCWWAAKLTSLIRPYLALLQCHGCLNQVGHVPQIYLQWRILSEGGGKKVSIKLLEAVEKRVLIMVSVLMAWPRERKDSRDCIFVSRRHSDLLKSSFTFPWATRILVLVSQ